MKSNERQKARLNRSIAGTGVWAITSLFLLLGVSDARQTTPSSKAAQSALATDLSGLWLRVDTAGSGNLTALDTNVPKPELVNPPANGTLGGRGGGANPPKEPPHAAGDPYIVTHGECDSTGAAGLLMMGHPAALDIVQTKDEIIVAGEVSNVRYFYLDGRSLPAFGTYDYVPVGYSVGHWEGDTLVVETVGVRAPALGEGGASSTDTHLFERYSLTGGGKRLTVTFTWVDPKIYLKPWSYTYDYDRLPAPAYALEEWCDSGDPMQRQSVVPPEQK